MLGGWGGVNWIRARKKKKNQVTGSGTIRETMTHLTTQGQSIGHTAQLNQLPLTKYGQFEQYSDSITFYFFSSHIYFFAISEPTKLR